MTDTLNLYKQYRRKILAYKYVNFISSWDLQTEAPDGSVENTSRQLEVITEESYRIQTDEKYVKCVEKLYAERDKLDEVTAHEVEKIKKELSQLKNIPKDEYIGYQQLLNKSYPVYVKAKQTGNFRLFLPVLKEIVLFNKKLCKWLETDTLKGYDVLLDNYEPQYTTKEYDAFFDLLRKKLVPFVKETVRNKLKYNDSFVGKQFDAGRQKQFCEYIRDVMCFDKTRGVMKESEHPFTSGFGTDDVRITVHYYPEMVESAIFSAIHETGHALYEQQQDKCLNETLCCGGASLGLHESQSRFYENIIGRSLAFWQTHFPRLQQTFPEQLEGITATDFYKHVNKAQCSFIRVDADELTYPLHIMLRYEMEREFIDGNLQVEDFPEYWNKLFYEYFGITPPDDSSGVLQDVHWAYGNIGYFPTYALGSAIASQLYAKMSSDIDVDKCIRSGSTFEINKWLKERVHKYGDSKYPKEILRIATGEDFNPDYYVEYLIKKYSDLYNAD